MSISVRQQLEAFAYWRRQLLAAPCGQDLWGLDAGTEVKLMNQAPLYALGQERVDFYLEAPLLGRTQVDLSAQYFAEAFAEGNPLQGLPVAQEGDFFHFYAKELAGIKPALLRHCNLYLEADIASEGEPKVASFINLSGDFVQELLPSVLAYRGRLKQLAPLRTLLDKVSEWCDPWHFGFMESREEKSLRLVLLVKQGLKGLRKALASIGTPKLPPEGWELLARAVREQLTAAFPGEEPDARALDALCTREALESAPFTLGAASMTLTYRADAVYPGHGTLLHVTVPYAQLRPEMTARGQAQTDNSRFRMAALTYDDGCAQKNTLNLLDQLRRYGAQATFFILGERIAGNHNVLSRQQNAGYSIQTHTWGHSYTWELSREEKEAERDRFAEALGAVTGVPPTLMRAPGGSEDGYDMGYPLIHWSLATGDSSNDNVEEIVERTKWSVKDGTIVLMHDINANCSRYTREIVESLTDRGFLLVTVQELFLDAGIPLEDGMVYGSTSRMWRVKE